MRPVQALRFLIPYKLEGSEAQLTEKQAVLSMHDTLPQGVKSVHTLLQKRNKRLQLAHRDLTRTSYIKSSSLTIIGRLMGGRIKNITIQISTMLQFKVTI